MCIYKRAPLSLRIIPILTTYLLTSISRAASTALEEDPSCRLIGEALAICASLSPGFTTFPPTSQAPCLCYSSTVWNPTLFDNAVETCADYASTAVPSAYGAIANLEGFCSIVGDIKHPASISANTTANTDCHLVNSLIESCAQSYSGFTSMNASDQASCLCYVSSTSWCPTSFDNAVTSCATFATTAAPQVYSAISGFSGFCGSIGGVMSVTTSDAPRPTSTEGASYSWKSASSTSPQMGFTLTVGPTETSSPQSHGTIVRLNEMQVILVSCISSAVMTFLW
ncbi:hypothetical protein B7494_g6255 [Chlorociboria aeruginascens]|nr:hypothetical protein B7494_g6255 [Chlorociboria aeruginascens]